MQRTKRRHTSNLLKKCAIIARISRSSAHIGGRTIPSRSGAAFAGTPGPALPTDCSMARLVKCAKRPKQTVRNSPLRSRSPAQWPPAARMLPTRSALPTDAKAPCHRQGAFAFTYRLIARRRPSVNTEGRATALPSVFKLYRLYFGSLISVQSETLLWP